MGVEFKKLEKEESARLKEALRRNAEEGRALHMDPLTTGWAPGQDEVQSEEEVLNAIKSVPCHY